MKNENKMLKNKATKTPLCAELAFTTKQRNKTGLLVTSTNTQVTEQNWGIAQGCVRLPKW